MDPIRKIPKKFGNKVINRQYGLLRIYELYEYCKTAKSAVVLQVNPEQMQDRKKA